jgi:hypothetical protein
MATMQTLASDILLMERGRSKAVTRKEHLERNDFIIEKQKKEMKRLDATRLYREHQLEMANQKMQETESITNALVEKANEKERQSEDLDRAISEKRSRLNKEKGSELLGAAVNWATGKSKAMKNEIENLRCEIATHEETIEQLQCQSGPCRTTITVNGCNWRPSTRRNLTVRRQRIWRKPQGLKNRLHGRAILSAVSVLLLKTSDIFRKAVHTVIRFACDYYKLRFDAEQASDIKSAFNLFGDDKQSHRAAEDFLYITATQKGKLENREQIKARREVDNVVEGQYDQQQKRGFSMRR